MRTELITWGQIDYTSWKVQVRVSVCVCVTWICAFTPIRRVLIFQILLQTVLYISLFFVSLFRSFSSTFSFLLPLCFLSHGFLSSQISSFYFSSCLAPTPLSTLLFLLFAESSYSVPLLFTDAILSLPEHWKQ